MLYRFENEDIALDEKKTLYSKFENGDIFKEDLNSALKKAGLVLFLTTVDLLEQEVYEIYRSRDIVEKHFNTFKNKLRADTIYLKNNEAIFGDVFTSFLSLYLYCKIMNRLKEARLVPLVLPHDLRTWFSNVYSYEMGGERELSEVPKMVRDLARKLHYNIFPN